MLPKPALTAKLLNMAKQASLGIALWNSILWLWFFLISVIKISMMERKQL